MISKEALRKALKSPALWLLLFLSVALPAMSLTGRYGGVPHYDLLWDTMNAHRLVTEGTIPEHGCVSGLFSFNPPGISYGFLPGMLIFPHRPVAAERVGAALLFVGTLCGLFLLVYPRLGGWAVSGTLLVFSFASGGMFFLTTLWPRGHVFFAVWILLFATLWVERRRSRWLAAAFVTYAAGMYWFMEIAPLIVLVPALWLVYRPPVRLRGMLAAVALSLLLWLPYLRFEAGRGFVDLKSLLTVSYAPGDFSVQKAVGDPSHYLIRSWEIPEIRARSATQSDAEAKKKEGGFWLSTREWGTVWAQWGLCRYLDEDGFIFYCTPKNDWYFQSVESGRILRRGGTEWERGSYLVDYPGYEVRAERPGFSWPILREKLKSFAPFYLLGDGQSFGTWLWHALLFFGTLCIVLWKASPRALLRRAGQRWRSLFSAEQGEGAGLSEGGDSGAIWAVLLLGWLLPVMLLLVLLGWHGMWGGERRFLWLWAVQAPILGCALSAPLLGRWRPALAVAVVALGTLSANPLTRRTLDDAFSAAPGHWLRNEDKAIDALAAAVRAEGRNAARIGYDTNQIEWLAQLRNVDGVSKFGIEWDVSLLLRHGITNLDTSPEGLSADDDFRVFSPQYEIPRSDFAQNRWSMTIDGSLPPMEKIAEAGGYQVLKKKK
jgi:hypothetical protein